MLAGEAFDRRPAKPVPRQIQQPDRDLAVDDRSARHNRRREPVLPGRGEQDEWPVVVIGGRDEPPGQFVNVFAATCPLAERRPIVEQNPHEWKLAGCYHASRASAATPYESSG